MGASSVGKHAARSTQYAFVRLVIALLLLVALGLRLCLIDAQDIWWDEARNISIAGQAMPTIASAPELDIHPPIYFYLLHVWILAFGNSAFAMRLLSTVFGLVGVALVYLQGRIWGGNRAGLASAAIAALAPFAVGEAQEARMYTLGLLWLCGASLCLWKALTTHITQERASWGLWLGFGLLSGLSLLTHYSAAFVLAAFAMFVVVRVVCAPRGLRLSMLSGVVGSGLAGVLLVLPQLRIALRQVPGYRNANLDVPSLSHYLTECWQAFTLGIKYDSQVARPWLWGIGIVVILGLALRGLESIRLNRRTTPELAGSRVGYPPHRAHGYSDSGGIWSLGLLLSWLIIPLALYYWVLLDRSTFDPRYIGFVAPALWVILGVAVAALWKRWIPAGVIASLFLVAAVIPALRSDLTDPAYFREDTSGLAAWLKREADSDDIVLVDQRYPLGFYYERWSNEFDGFPPSDPSVIAPAQYLFVDINAIDGRLNQLCAGRDRVYWVEWFRTDTDPRGVVDYLLSKQGRYLGEQGFRGYRVRWYDIDEDVSFALATDLASVNVRFDNQVVLEAWGAGTGAAIGAPESSGALPRSAWSEIRWRQLDGATRPLKVSLRVVSEDGRTVAQNDRDLINDRHVRLPNWGAHDSPLNVYLLQASEPFAPGEYTWQVVVYDPDTLDGLGWSTADSGNMQGGPYVLGDPFHISE